MLVARLPIKTRWPMLQQQQNAALPACGERQCPSVSRGACRISIAPCPARWRAPAAAQQVSPTIAELATYAGADRTERLIAGAKKEGVVSVYSSVTVDDQKALVNAFEKKYGVKLQFWRASSESILQRAHGGVSRRPLRGRRDRDRARPRWSRCIARSSWSR